MRRPVRVGLATLLAAVLLLLVRAGVPPPAAAADPFALPDQITDQITAVQADTATIRAALEDLEAEHGVRMWVVFVDSFDGTAPQRWADQAFAATGLGPSDYLLAVAMGDRQYGYVVDEDFVLSDAALDRVAIAAERHLAENPARALTVAAQAIADEITDGSNTNVLVAAVVALVVALYVAVAARASRRRATGQRGGDDFFGEPREYDKQRWTKSPGGSSGSSWFRVSSGSGWVGGSHDTWSSHGGWGGGSSSGGGGGTRGGSGSF